MKHKNYPMTFLDFITGPLIFFPVLSLIITQLDNKVLYSLLTTVKGLSHVRIGDEKGVVLMFLNIVTLFLFHINSIISVSKTKPRNGFYRRMKNVRCLWMQNSFVLLSLYISSYIYGRLAIRTSNLFIFSIISMIMKSYGIMTDVKLLKLIGGIGFFVCAVFLFSFCFLTSTDYVIDLIKMMMMWRK